MRLLLAIGRGSKTEPSLRLSAYNPAPTQISTDDLMQKINIGDFHLPTTATMKLSLFPLLSGLPLSVTVHV